MGIYIIINEKPSYYYAELCHHRVTSDIFFQNGYTSFCLTWNYLIHAFLCNTYTSPLSTGHCKLPEIFGTLPILYSGTLFKDHLDIETTSL